MMQVYIDGKPLADAGTTLSSALDAARRTLGDRMVIEVEADGRIVPGEHLADPPADDPYASELRLTSADAGLLVREMLHETCDVLRDMPGLHARCGQMLQEGRTGEAMDPLGEALDAWDGVSRALGIARSMMDLGDYPAESLESALAAHLRTIREAMRVEDFTTVADVLLYDMDEVAQSFLRCATGAAAGADAQQHSADT